MFDAEDAYRRFRAGEEEGFRELVLAFREGLIAYLQRYVRDTACATELAEDVFVALLLRPDRYRPGTSLKAYLYGIARHKALNELRRRGRHPVLSLEDLTELPGDELTESLWEKREDRRRLREALAELKDDYRDALILIYWENMSYDEVGRVLGKSRKQVENLAYRGRAALKRILTKEDGGHE